MKATLRIALLSLAALGSSTSLAAASALQEDATPRLSLAHYNLSGKGLALEGHDPVAYFPEGGGKPLAGTADHALEHAGVTYHFASAANLAKFEADPRRYEPAYGGWCAYAMADGDKVGVDVDSFRIRDGRLFLFYDGLFNDTAKKWDKKPAEYVRDADPAWERLSGEDALRERPPQAPRDVSQFNLGKRGLALAGYDPVSYFPVERGGVGAPRKGSEAFSKIHRGAVYHFVSAQSLATFAADPDAFEPAYGGWCAYAMSKGKRADIDPEAFVLQDGKLLVFYRKGKADTRNDWQQDPEGGRRKADAEWRDFLK